jgi:glutaredoxin
MFGQVEVYTKDNCPFCNRAKQLLNTMNISFSEQKLDRDFTREFLLEKFPNAKTYPVVVVDGFHIGGYTQLAEMVNTQTKSTSVLLNEKTLII